jgi:catechol 2,3-dioxygenase-like lactoylglutathione lyase family enzyme
MERMIGGLLASYESGTLTRRALIKGLAMLAAAGTTVSAAGITGAKLDHFSLQVSNLQRSSDFYRNVLSLSVNTAPRPDGSVRLDFPQGGYMVLRDFSPPGQVDHVGISLEGFNKDVVTQQLKEHGVVPIDEPNFSRTRDNPASGAGFHVVDPDGFNVQLL